MTFELFRAPYSDACGYEGAGVCSLCHTHAEHRFSLRSAEIIATCASCGVATALDACSLAEGACQGCGAAVRVSCSGKDPTSCESCLHAGRAGFVHSTEFGLVSWSGPMIHHFEEPPPRPTMELPNGGVMLSPSMARKEEPRVEDFSSDALRQLSGTPRFSAWQEPVWLFCCHKPMVFLGYWQREHFNAAANDGDGRSLCQRIVGDHIADTQDWGCFEAGGVCVFRCGACDRQRGYWDLS